MLCTSLACPAICFMSSASVVAVASNPQLHPMSLHRKDGIFRAVPPCPIGTCFTAPHLGAQGLIAKPRFADSSVISGSRRTLRKLRQHHTVQAGHRSGNDLKRRPSRRQHTPQPQFVRSALLRFSMVPVIRIEAQMLESYQPPANVPSHPDEAVNLTSMEMIVSFGEHITNPASR